MSEWQPIETAPKDGTWFLAYEADVPMYTAHWDEDGWYDLEWKCRPTHWMPLPEPPSGPSAQG